MLDWFKSIRNIINPRKEFDEMQFKVWSDKVKGLVPVEIEPDSDLVIFHMALDWAPEPQQWCEENCEGHYVFGHFTVNGSVIFFQYEHDAMAFKLRWT